MFDRDGCSLLPNSNEGLPPSIGGRMPGSPRPGLPQGPRAPAPRPAPPVGRRPPLESGPCVVVDQLGDDPAVHRVGNRSARTPKSRQSRSVRPAGSVTACVPSGGRGTMSASELIGHACNGGECDSARRSLCDPGAGRRPRLSEKERWRSTSGALAKSEESAMGVAGGGLSAPAALTGPARAFRRWSTVMAAEIPAEAVRRSSGRIWRRCGSSTTTS